MVYALADLSQHGTPSAFVSPHEVTNRNIADGAMAYVSKQFRPFSNT
jgi:hypothetical protein